MKRQVVMASLLAACCAFSLPASVQAGELGWTSAPVLLPAPAKGGNRRTQSLVKPVNLTSEQVMVHPPFKGDTPSEPWAAEMQDGGTFAVKSRGEGNYHWITASSSDGRQFASSVYYFSNPGAAPRQLLQQNQLPLEIKPLALPREHNQFRANESWMFQTSYQGKPLPNATVRLDTSNGAHQVLSSDANGEVRVRFPDDFGVADPSAHAGHGTGGNGVNAGGHGGGHGGRSSAQFALSVEHNGMTSAFNYKYAQDAFTDKAVLPAVGFVFAGMLLASPLLLRRRKKA